MKLLSQALEKYYQLLSKDSVDLTLTRDIQIYQFPCTIINVPATQSTMPPPPLLSFTLHWQVDSLPPRHLGSLPSTYNSAQSPSLPPQLSHRFHFSTKCVAAML